MIRRPPRSPLFPYPPLSRSPDEHAMIRPRLRVLSRVLRAETIAAPRENVAQPAETPRACGRAELTAAAHLDGGVDRKSTRLNSSHGYISYAVFCLKKKKSKC